MVFSVFILGLQNIRITNLQLLFLFTLNLVLVNKFIQNLNQNFILFYSFIHIVVTVLGDGLVQFWQHPIGPYELFVLQFWLFKKSTRLVILDFCFFLKRRKTVHSWQNKLVLILNPTINLLFLLFEKWFRICLLVTHAFSLIFFWIFIL